ncbi:ABC transporter permease [Solimonas variicoloris]|uniref:ABC transporter permease n=1 Tax=Solimonas variicoloris TaxID=254408 RepID=UPI00037D1148|nr:ABC transporter permease [Solimonas variicoloris]
MRAGHAAQALFAICQREVRRFVQQRSRLLSALVRPTLWLAVFAAGFQNVFGMSVVEPYDRFVTYQEYVAPGLLGMVLLFNGMQSSLAMVYDREMGMMRLLLTAPLPRVYLLACKLLAGTVLSMLQAYAFLAVCAWFGVGLPWGGWLSALPALLLCGLMLGALGLLLAATIRQLENFAGAMNFVIFPMFFLSSALYPLWKLQESGATWVWWLARFNPFTHAVELIRYALYGRLNGEALTVVAAATLLFFIAAALGFDPQRGLVRLRRQAG